MPVPSPLTAHVQLRLSRQMRCLSGPDLETPDWVWLHWRPPALRLSRSGSFRDDRISPSGDWTAQECPAWFAPQGAATLHALQGEQRWSRPLALGDQRQWNRADLHALMLANEQDRAKRSRDHLHGSAANRAVNSAPAPTPGPTPAALRRAAWHALDHGPLLRAWGQPWGVEASALARQIDALPEPLLCSAPPGIVSAQLQRWLGAQLSAATLAALLPLSLGSSGGWRWRTAAQRMSGQLWQAEWQDMRVAWRAGDCLPEGALRSPQALHAALLTLRPSPESLSLAIWTVTGRVAASGAAPRPWARRIDALRRIRPTQGEDSNLEA